jgi:hypothetical protein
MLLTYLMLVVALCLSAVAAFYSIVGLTAIFAAAVIPIVIMGSILEAAKLVVTVWLHEYWHQIKLSMKLYLVPAVFILMVITSMGIFGFLSKAHTDQALVSGDAGAKLAIVDEKIKIERENIANARAVIQQMDAAVTGVIATGDQETKLKDGSTQIRSAAERSLQIRRSQARDREALTRQIEEAQTRIVRLQEESAPMRAEFRKVEAEVGPIKYIAALIYGDNPDANLLEKAVRWVIIILVVVFDPLAIMMLLAFTESLRWERTRRAQQPREEPQDGTDNDNGAGTPTGVDRSDDRSMVDEQPAPEVVPADPEPTATENIIPDRPQVIFVEEFNEPDYYDMDKSSLPDDRDEKAAEKQAKRDWKAANPDDTIHRHETLLEQGKIDRLPWQEELKIQADTEQYANVDFGTNFPSNPNKGDAYIRVDYLPSKLFKWNGTKWIEVDKDTTDSFTYNDNYIDHLIAKISSGEYDPELLNDNEREQIEQRLRNDDQPGGINV